MKTSKIRRCDTVLNTFMSDLSIVCQQEDAYEQSQPPTVVFQWANRIQVDCSTCDSVANLMSSSNSKHAFICASRSAMCDTTTGFIHL